jgi:deazaflavin-dependent oxidoreductase (nitroreductase family)
MPLIGEYEPSPEKWVRDQVELYERTGGREGYLLAGTPWPVVIFTTRGNRSGKLRKVPLMRVEHEGRYAMVASQGGAPKHPVWYYNLKADPDAVTVQDGDTVIDGHARELDGEEREVWWKRAVEAYPPYAEYQTKTDRVIPVFLVEPR